MLDDRTQVLYHESVRTLMKIPPETYSVVIYREVLAPGPAATMRLFASTMTSVFQFASLRNGDSFSAEQIEPYLNYHGGSHQATAPYFAPPWERRALQQRAVWNPRAALGAGLD
jgi:hypothetical protein